MNTPSEAFLRRRRFFLALPLLVLPFLAMAFWALGGGKGSGEEEPVAAGLNLQLPEPQLKEEKKKDKLSLYNLLQRQGSQSQEPGLAALFNGAGLPSDSVPLSGSASFSPPLPDPQEEKINQKLTQLSALLHEPPAGPAAPPKPEAPASKSGGDPFTRDVEKLEAMMRSVGNGAGDPEMQQIESMLEKILDIQHPDRVQEKRKLETAENRQQLLPLHTPSGQVQVSLLAPAAREESAMAGYNGFYALQNQPAETAIAGNVIEVAVHETQTLTTGAVVKLRLLQEVQLQERRLPEGALLYGTCRLSNDRLAIDVNAVRHGDAILPVNLTAYDLNGLEGLYVPGSVTSDAARQGTERILGQGLPLPSLTSSVGLQAAGAGIEAVKSLVGRRVRQVKVTVKAGHRLLLLDRNTPF